MRRFAVLGLLSAVTLLSSGCLLYRPVPVTPGPGNTGVPAGTVLSAPTDGFTVTTPGAVIDSRDIVGSVIIDAPNVVITRSRFTGNGDDYAILVDSGNVIIEDSEIRGGYHVAGLAFDNWTARRLNVHDVPADGFKLGNNTILQDSWLHDFTPDPLVHADGVQMQYGVQYASVSHNYIDVAGNSAIFLAPDEGPSTNGPVAIVDNILGGGNYTLYVVDGNNGQYVVGNISVNGNKFLRDFRYGPVSVTVPVNWSNNTWMDTGGVISTSGGTSAKQQQSLLQAALAFFR